MRAGGGVRIGSDGGSSHHHPATRTQLREHANPTHRNIISPPFAERKPGRTEHLRARKNDFDGGTIPDNCYRRSRRCHATGDEAARKPLGISGLASTFRIS
ncbi:uncharacterized protein SEPMUDRAFT_152044 [Sphaerulina musiva SO2202]|uniref:Uncharacterized protein n=1 Tax=Sphaerulina musiva (strain SO2202) TaxID=692275 RepID=M3C918_SPHMS|nr:uncharacterized protein SEPMUDRAFT_152044 [Sphaerulina musiva SO2202]EMF08355.1 hypothetical protein SEPMUDRAFT_152044 [Sphaerulina musiva SO2202]